MKRRNFIGLFAAGSGAMIGTPLIGSAEMVDAPSRYSGQKNEEIHLSADIVIVGGGLGGCAAALAALRNQQTVILTEETDWIGGQLTQQGVPPDEHQWIETHGATQLYRDLRTAIRQYYIRNYPLTETARNKPFLNPGDGSVSRLCHEPRVALAVITEMFAPYISSGKLTLLTEHKVKSADADTRKVHALEVTDLRSGRVKILNAPYFVDATETGELLPLTHTEFVTGAESRKQTGELHAPENAAPKNNQSFTSCFAMDYVTGENHTIEKPGEYDFWRNYRPELSRPWTGRLLDLEFSEPITLKPKKAGFHPEGIATGDALNLWNYRRIISKNNFIEGSYRGDITIVNWPQNDYMLGNLIDASPKEFKKHTDCSKQLSLSLLYWLQTEVPRMDGGKGWPGLRLRKDIMGTEDGLAKYPYIRESRRIKALFTVLEEHVGQENRALVTGNKTVNAAAMFDDSVGVGYYRIDLHPDSNGVNYIDIASFPFQIPLGALLPQQMENLIPANKNIGTTHITNGCYRLHPVEWNIGEAVGSLISFANNRKVTPRQVREKKEMLEEFQTMIRAQGIETHWPTVQAIAPGKE